MGGADRFRLRADLPVRPALRPWWSALACADTVAQPVANAGRDGVTLGIAQRIAVGFARRVTVGLAYAIGIRILRAQRLAFGRPIGLPVAFAVGIAQPVTHVFVGAHPDDIALSCGGLLASLRDLGQAVTIISVFSGSPGSEGSRITLGFGNKAVWPLTEAFRRDNIGADYAVTPSVSTGRPPWMTDPERLELTQDRANTQARQFWQRAAWTRSANITAVAAPERPLSDGVAAQGSTEPIDYATADERAHRRIEEERFAYLMEASLVFLDLPDATARGYSGDDQLLGRVREDDVAIDDVLYREIARLEPQMVYMPLAVGNHIDHQIVRDCGLALLAEGRRWVMPGPNFVGRLSFYEDFPYAWWADYEGPLSGGRVNLDLPVGVGIDAGYADISEMMDRKAAGISLYTSTVPQLFDSRQGMLDDLAGYHKRVALAGQVNGYAERYWATTAL